VVSVACSTCLTETGWLQISGIAWKFAIARALSYPYPSQLPYLSTLASLEQRISETVELLTQLDDKFVDDGASVAAEEDLEVDEEEEEELGGDGADAGGHGGDDDEEDGDQQSHFGWFADFVVVINAGTMAAQGFNDEITPILSGVGYFASIFFIVEAYIKSIAYGGLGYYLNDSSNSFDFVLVVVPTVGEVTTITTDLLGLGDDYIYQVMTITITDCAGTYLADMSHRRRRGTHTKLCTGKLSSSLCDDRSYRSNKQYIDYHSNKQHIDYRSDKQHINHRSCSLHVVNRTQHLNQPLDCTPKPSALNPKHWTLTPKP
jgi:hypothetical protein